ncbi:BTB/POZ protein [Rhizophagus irregularis DAOM 181602=DAOM 197198]|nr:BTB/POZ protein [Rhizophagus irregularis DAOM 181602=DAOM 197198]
MVAQFFSKLSQNYIELLKDDEYYDVTIEVGEDPNVKIFRAHMNILCYRSPYLRRALASNKKNNDNVLSHIKLPNVSPEIFQIILEYTYGGILSLDEKDTSDFIKVLATADILNPDSVTSHNIQLPRKIKIDENIEEVICSLIVNSGTEEIIGGYNPVIWESPQSACWCESSDSFIFSFKNKNNFKDAILSKIVYSEYALWFGSVAGPYFGSDIVIYSSKESADYNTIKYRKRRYEKMIRDCVGEFAIEDYEVFHLIKK